MLGLWPLHVWVFLFLLSGRVAKHIHIEQEGILLQAIDLRVEVFTLPTSGQALGPRPKHAEVASRCPALPGSLVIGVSTVSISPLGPVRVLELPQQTIGCWGGKAEELGLLWA